MTLHWVREHGVVSCWLQDRHTETWGTEVPWLIRERGWQYPQSLKQSCVPLGPRLALRDRSLCPFCPGNPAYWRQKIRGTSPHDGKSHGHPLWQGWDPVTQCLSWALPVPSDGVSRANPTLEQSRQVLNT